MKEPVEEKPNMSLEFEMDGHRLDVSTSSSSIMLTADIDFWTELYAELCDVFEDLEDAESDGDST